MVYFEAKQDIKNVKIHFSIFELWLISKVTVNVQTHQNGSCNQHLQDYLGPYSSTAQGKSS